MSLNSMVSHPWQLLPHPDTSPKLITLRPHHLRCREELELHFIPDKDMKEENCRPTPFVKVLG